VAFANPQAFVPLHCPASTTVSAVMLMILRTVADGVNT
jgi:hypothetical protein